jgi:hypothetical protein
MKPTQYLADLLDALERHTQAVQANTAAVNSLLGRRADALAAAKGSQVLPAPVLDQLDREVTTGLLEAIAGDVGRQLDGLGAIADRLELLRQSLTIDQAPKEATHESTGPATTG